MPDQDLLCFQKLKEEVAQTFLQNHSASNSNIREWKGQDITDFQEDLFQRTRGRISEKWFYTHIKAASQKLPRIDMLNLLSAYAGYSNWAEFRDGQAAVLTDSNNPPELKKKRHIQWWAIPVFLVIGTLGWWLFPTPTVYHFCFTDADRGVAITGQPIELEILRSGETPLRLAPDSSGCVQLTSESGQLRFVVRSPYYQTDTITRIISESGSEHIPLRTNDYALMIHLFSTADRAGWERRRKQLDRMIAEEAELYQVGSSGNLTLELYNKQEFINKLTMPLASLKNIEVLETLYRGDQIIKMRFRQKPGS